MEVFFEFIPVFQNICIGVGVVGLIVLLLGVYRGSRFLKTRGAYILVLAIVVLVCGHVIYKKTMERLPDKLNEMYQPY